MATKKMYFSKMILKNGNHQCDNSVSIRKVFQDIEKKYSKNKSLSLDINEEGKYTMDRIQFDGNKMFARLGKKQDTNSLGKRDTNRNISPILDSLEQQNFWIDKLTYILVDFELGIFSIVNNQSAPKANVFLQAFSKYSSYTLELEDLPNKTYYERLFRENSNINKISFRVPVPNIEFLQQIKGITDKQINKLMSMDSNLFEIVIGHSGQNFLTSNKDTIKDYILDVVENIDEFESFKIEGKSGIETRHTFDLKEEYFSYTIKIDNYKHVNGEKIEKTHDEIYLEYKNEMEEAFLKNNSYLRSITS